MDNQLRKLYSWLDMRCIRTLDTSDLKAGTGNFIPECNKYIILKTLLPGASGKIKDRFERTVKFFVIQRSGNNTKTVLSNLYHQVMQMLNNN